MGETGTDGRTVGLCEGMSERVGSGEGLDW